VPLWELWCVWRSVSNRLEKKRVRGNSQLLPIATCVGCFVDRVAIFIEDSSLIFLQFRSCDCLLEVCRSVKNFVKSCCPQQVPVTINLGCFGNSTVESPPIALKFLLKFYHSQLVVLDGRIWDRSCSLFPENSWTLSIFLVTRFLNSYLLILICWYFWAIVGDRFED